MAVRIAFQEQLNELKNQLSQMGSLCVLSVQLAVQAVSTGDQRLFAKTEESMESIKKKDQDIESLCLKLLLQQQPVAADLRLISSALKMIYDLQRIGEQSADIADISRFVVLSEGKVAEDIRSMAQDVIKMVTDSINAFVGNDLNLANAVIALDDIVDSWFVRIKDDLVRAITEGKTQAEYALEALMTAKYLEKIGDHAENVADWVVYSVTGNHPDS